MMVTYNTNVITEYDRNRQGFLVHHSIWNMTTAAQSNSPLNMNIQSSDKTITYGRNAQLSTGDGAHSIHSGREGKERDQSATAPGYALPLVRPELEPALVLLGLEGSLLLVAPMGGKAEALLLTPPGDPYATARRSLECGEDCTCSEGHMYMYGCVYVNVC